MLALRRRAVREAVGHDIALRAALDRVVADGGGGVQRLVDVARLENAFRLGVVGPDPGEAIRLQLGAHRQSARADLAGLPRLRLLQNAEKLLDMVADLMRQHVSLGEVAGRAEALLQLGVEVEIDINVLVVRAVERSAGGGRRSATRLHARRRRASASDRGIARPPAAAAAPSRYPPCRRARSPRRSASRRSPGRGRRLAAFLALLIGTGRLGVAARQERQRVDAEKPGDDQHDDNGADAAACAPHDERTAPAEPAAEPTPAEDRLPRRERR